MREQHVEQRDERAPEQGCRQDRRVAEEPMVTVVLVQPGFLR